MNGVFDQNGKQVGFVMYEASCLNPECGHGVLSHSVQTDECMTPNCPCKKWLSPVKTQY